MKTSPSQFEILVTFMEQHGDLTKPSSNARGRINTIQHWDDLKDMLNSDGSGDTKTSEKWKKVWSDFKNNTKKKAARIHRAASGTGGGPANYSKLTDLEQRVLNLIGMQVATGLAVDEAGFPQDVHAEQNVPDPAEEPSPRIPIENFILLDHSVMDDGTEPWNEAGPSSRAPTCPPPQSPQIFRDTSASPPRVPMEADVVAEIAVDTNQLTPPCVTRVPIPPAPSRPALVGQTTPRRGRSTRPRGSPRRHVRPAHTEQAAQQFLHSDEEWRRLKIQQHRDNMDMRREQNRIRDMELQTQREWQAVGLRALDILDKLVDKYCKE